NHKDTIETILTAYPGADRFEVIRCILDRLPLNKLDFGRPKEDLLDFYARKYNSICEEAVGTCPETHHATKGLKNLKSHYPLFLNSDTPEDPLRRIIDKRGWSVYFNGIYGRPETKEANLNRVAQKAAASPDQMVFIGDQE